MVPAVVISALCFVRQGSGVVSEEGGKIMLHKVFCMYFHLTALL